MLDYGAGKSSNYDWSGTTIRLLTKGKNNYSLNKRKKYKTVHSPTGGTKLDPTPLHMLEQQTYKLVISIVEYVTSHVEWNYTCNNCFFRCIQSNDSHNLSTRPRECQCVLKGTHNKKIHPSYEWAMKNHKKTTLPVYAIAYKTKHASKVTKIINPDKVITKDG